MKFLLIAGSAAVIYLALAVIVRLLGKKELTKLSVYDLVFWLLITNAVQNMIRYPKREFLEGLVIVGTLFVANYIFKYIIYRFPKISKLISRNAIMLIYNGNILKGNLVRAMISAQEIEEMAMQNGIGSLEDISFAIAETDGTVTIISDGNKINFKKRAGQNADDLL